MEQNPGGLNVENPPDFDAAIDALFDRLRDQIQALRELQKKYEDKRLQDKEMTKNAECLEFGLSMTNMPTPPSMLRNGGPREQPPLAGELVNSNTSHLSLILKRRLIDGVENPGWTVEALDQLCSKIKRECKETLRSLSIVSGAPEGSHPGLSMLQLALLLLELRGLTTLHLDCESFKKREDNVLLGIAALGNPDIRSVWVPVLTKAILSTITAAWPELESLESVHHNFDPLHLKGVLPKLRNLKQLKIHDMLDRDLSRIVLSVVQTRDPSTRPYQLAGFFFRTDCCYSGNSDPSENLADVFIAFPALNKLHVEEDDDIPDICAGLEELEHIRIEALYLNPHSSDPLSLEPLLARVGKHVIHVDISGDCDSFVDLSAVGHYCPNLEYLYVETEELADAVAFEDYSFPKLKYAFLLCDEKYAPDQPDVLVSRLMTSPTLEDVTIRGLAISEGCLASLIAAGEQSALNTLKSLTVCHLTSVAVVAELISHAPRLQKVAIMDWPHKCPEHKGVLPAFLKKSGLMATISFGYEDE